MKMAGDVGGRIVGALRGGCGGGGGPPRPSAAFASGGWSSAAFCTAEALTRVSVLWTAVYA